VNAILLWSFETQPQKNTGAGRPSKVSLVIGTGE
jgi:hypothetical protein